MPTEFKMPKLGLTMEEGTVVRWLASEGETVQAGQVILEVQTDKVTVEVESPVDGVLGTPLVREGQATPVGGLLAWIAEPGAIQPRQPRVAPLARRIAAGAGIDLATVAEGRDRVTAADVRPPLEEEAAPAKHFSSPRARKLAREAGVDWRELDGSGPRGRVVERDVVSHEHARPAKASTPGAGAGVEALAGMPPAREGPARTGAGIHWEDPTPIQRVGAERTTAAFATVPHFYLTAEASAEALVQVREQLLPAVERRAGVRLTITDLLVKIAATALLEHPRANAFWQDGRIGMNERVDIGIATATDAGLIVPVLKAAGDQPLAQIAKERARLVAAARAGRLAPEDIAGGTFTLSNLGAHRVDQFQPVLNTSPNAPQSVILAAGRIAPRPFVVDGALVVARTVMLTIACDHRVLDGALAAAFFDRLVGLIEAPYEILV